MTISSYEKLELQTHREALTISVSVSGGTVASLRPPKPSSIIYLDFEVKLRKGSLREKVLFQSLPFQRAGDRNLRSLVK